VAWPVIHVRGRPKVELKEKKMRVDDAVHAVRAAAEEGVVAGGGVALVRAIKKRSRRSGSIMSAKAGAEAVERAMSEPLKHLRFQRGTRTGGDFQTGRRGKGDYGYNAATDEFEDLVRRG